MSDGTIQLDPLDATEATDAGPSITPEAHGDQLADNWIDRAVGRRSERKLILGLLGFAIALRALMFGFGYTQIQLAPNSGRNGQTKNASATVDGLGKAYGRFRFADPVWYLKIADNGYDERPYTDKPQSNWGFFPGWPMLIWIGSFLLGGKSLLAAVLLANLCSLAAIPLLYRLFRLDWSRGIAFGSVIAFLAWANAYDFMWPGNESLYLLTLVGAVYAARRERWWIAGIVGGFAAITRPFGILLLPMLGIILLKQLHERHGHLWTRATLLRRDAVEPCAALLLIPAAFGAYLLYMRSITGNAFAYFDIQRVAWAQYTQYPFQSVWSWLHNPVLTSKTGWEFLALSIVLGIGIVGLCGYGIAKRRELHFPIEYWLFIGLNMLVIVSRENAGGVGRYMAVVFPLFALFVIATIRRPVLQVSLILGSLMFQAFLFVNFFQGHAWAG
jgi:Dolichyl-phosphate-mannose-protein mannosyltransferase